MPADTFHLDRFVAAQDAGGTYDRAVAELRAAKKVSHWMWFVFPQLAGLGLGMSEMSQRYAISSLQEASAYLAHPILGPRLLECAGIVVSVRASAKSVFGPIDTMKLRSSMTLFSRATPSHEVFRAVIDRLFDGVEDEETERLLESAP